ncbi:hypothetical protein FA95DRAFT_1554550 [Auriscalpium vulgare]|uniref:Uncharacterized protein n=1 Tax=Auriscalpium vulgare TaxID=40419 RepID=A0ACB8S6R8_9AGAM|nr:hypothetical protein FA95DRAFT_1554550 [Auriscalpium vulgare]
MSVQDTSSSEPVAASGISNQISATSRAAGDPTPGAVPPEKNIALSPTKNSSPVVPIDEHSSSSPKATPSTGENATQSPTQQSDSLSNSDTSSTGTVTPPLKETTSPQEPSSGPVTPTNSTTPIAESPAPGQIPDPETVTSPHKSARDSLTSSRPAPPSPAASRRTSAALSRSSTRSRPSSTFTSTPAASSRLSVTDAEPDVDTGLTLDTPKPPTASSMLVKIRDFAFPPSDARHIGTGPLTPRPNKRLRRPMSTWSSSSASSAGERDEAEADAETDDAGRGSWNGFGGWGMRHLSWFGGVRDPAAAPSQGDFARNFADDLPEGVDAPEDVYSDPDEFDDDDEGEGDGERELLPGMYRAVYAFDPEGTAEMALEEDQMVRVIGRGGGVGWAIVVREGGEGHALVPEDYLEPVRLDRDADSGDEDEG